MYAVEFNNRESEISVTYEEAVVLLFQARILPFNTMLFEITVKILLNQTLPNKTSHRLPK